MQHRIRYNVIMSLPFSGRVAANVPVLMAAGNRARIEFLPRGSALVVLAIALILAAVVWARQCARTRMDSRIDQAAGCHGTRSARQAMKRMVGRLGGSRVPSRAARFAGQNLREVTPQRCPDRRLFRRREDGDRGGAGDSAALARVRGDPHRRQTASRSSGRCDTLPRWLAGPGPPAGSNRARPCAGNAAGGSDHCLLSEHVP
jgi:hypothetical protein